MDDPIAWLNLGSLRPGYSPIHQPISDLGVGANGQIVDGLGFLEGLLRIGFAIGLLVVLKGLPSAGWRVTGVSLVGLFGVARLVVSIFTDAPATVAIHSAATMVTLLSLLLAFAVLGVSLLNTPRLGRWGAYTLLTAALTVLLIAAEFMAFRPASAIGSAHIGGLLERILGIEIEAWFVALGLRLVTLSPLAQGAQEVSAA